MVEKFKKVPKLGKKEFSGVTEVPLETTPLKSEYHRPTPHSTPKLVSTPNNYVAPPRSGAITRQLYLEPNKPTPVKIERGNKCNFQEKCGPVNKEGQLIGGGHFGQAYLYTCNKLNNAKLVLKKMRFRPENTNMKHSANLEENAFKQLIYRDSIMDNVMVPLEACDIKDENDGYIRRWFISEYVEGMPLKECRLKPNFVRKLGTIFWTAANGLNNMHNFPMAHRDLHPGNIIVGDNNQSTIIDIGLACFGIQCFHTAGKLVNWSPLFWKASFNRILNTDPLHPTVNFEDCKFNDVFALGLCIGESVLGKSYLSETDVKHLNTQKEKIRENPSKWKRTDVQQYLDNFLGRKIGEFESDFMNNVKQREIVNVPKKYVIKAFKFCMENCPKELSYGKDDPPKNDYTSSTLLGILEPGKPTNLDNNAINTTGVVTPSVLRGNRNNPVANNSDANNSTARRIDF